MIPEPIGNMNVEVRNQEGTPIPGAVVARYGGGWSGYIDEKVTDTNGEVLWENITSGQYELEAYYNGEYWVTASASVPDGGATVDVILQRDEPYAYDLRVKIASNGEDVTNGSVPAETPLQFEVFVRNSSPASRTVRVKLWIDRDQAVTYDFSPTSAPQDVPDGGGTRTFTFDFTPPESGTYYRQLEVETYVNGSYTKTDSWAWDTAVTATASTAPIADAGTLSGQPTSMQPGERFTVTADYTDPDGAADLRWVYLRLTNPNDPANPLTVMWDFETGWRGPWAECQPYLVLADAQRTGIANGYRVTWTFYLTGKWTAANGGIDFSIYAEDYLGQHDGWNTDDSSSSYNLTPIPPDSWTILVHGKSGAAPGWMGYIPESWPEGMTSWFRDASEPGTEGWLWNLADQIGRIGMTEYAIHRVLHHSFELETWNGAAYVAHTGGFDDAKQHILLFDWERPSDYVFPGGSDNWYAYAAGDALYALIRRLAVHDKVGTIVGYSRGAVVSSEAARRLLASGTTGFQVLYLDGEGWAPYADDEFRAWTGTRTDQYRAAEGESWFGGWCGGDELVDPGNDRVVHNWPEGSTGHAAGDRIGHGAYPEYLREWCYATEDAASGKVVIETPQMWHDDVGWHPTLATPTLAVTPPPTIFAGDLSDGSQAGWIYQGGDGGGRIGWSVLALSDCINLSILGPSRRHNWLRAPAGVTHLVFDMMVPDGWSDDQLQVSWVDAAGSSEWGILAELPHFGWFAGSVSAVSWGGNVGRVEFGILPSGPVDCSVLIDNVAFETTDVPLVGGLTNVPNPVVRGTDLALTALDVTDGDGIDSVGFYRDSNDNGVLDIGIDESLGFGAPVAGADWSLTVPTAGFPVGAQRYFARAKDTRGVWGDEVSTVGTVEEPVNAPPEIGAFTDSPDPVDRGSDVALSCTDVSDDGSVVRVEFYRDNGDGVLDVGTDTHLDTDNTVGTSASVTVDTTGFPVGTVRYLAVAYDNEGVASDVASTVGRIRQLWTLSYSIDPGSEAGSISEDPAAGDYEHGTLVNPTAEATSGWRFLRWEANGGTVGMPIALVEDTDVAAVFETVAAVAPVVAEIPDDDASAGVPYSGPIPLLEQGTPPVVWSLPQGPAGMTIDSGSGVVSWPNPTPPGSDHPVTLRATNSAGFDDEDWSIHVNVAGQVSAPVFSPGGGVYVGAIEVVVTCGTEGSAIHYTTNGLDPTQSDPSIASGAGISVDRSLVLKARAWKPGWTQSPVLSGSYAIGVLEPPVMSQTRYAGDALLYGTKIYYLGGATTGGSTPVTIMAYDLVSGTWDIGLSPMITGRMYLGIAELSGIIHAAGGFSGGHYDVLELYDVNSDMWTTGQAMIHSCSCIGGATLSWNGKLYAAGGNYLEADRDVLQIYDPSAQAGSRWSQSSSIGYAARGLAAAVLGNRVYTIGGADHEVASSTYYNTVKAYEPVTDTWQTKSSLPAAREHAEAVAAGGYIYVIGGRCYHDGPVAREILRYTPGEDKWETVGMLSDETARYGMAAVMVGSKVLLLGGMYLDTGEIVSRVDVLDTSLLEPLIPEINVTGNGQSIAHGDVTPSPADYTDFGTVFLGGSLTRTYVITNTGMAELELTGTPKVELGGTDAGDFAVSLQPASPVAPSNSTTFSVQFAPSAEGLRQATVSIANNDGDENPYTFDIQGTGTNVTGFLLSDNGETALNGTHPSDGASLTTGGWTGNGGAGESLSYSTDRAKSAPLSLKTAGYNEAGMHYDMPQGCQSFQAEVLYNSASLACNDGFWVGNGDDSAYVRIGTWESGDSQPGWLGYAYVDASGTPHAGEAIPGAPSFSNDQWYRYRITVSSGQATFTVDDGATTGTVTVAVNGSVAYSKVRFTMNLWGNYSHTAYWDDFYIADAYLDLPLEITTELLPSGMEMVPYSACLRATNGILPYKWSVKEGIVELPQANSFTAVGSGQTWNADDSCWALSIPFQFPFYGKNRDTLYINSNGTITFDGSFSQYWSDLNTLKNREMIAPMWRDLTTYSPDDVYVEVYASEVTVRWAAHYYGGGPEVNFSVSLTESGQIHCRYGAGNVNGGMIGVSAGEGQDYLLSAQSDVGSMENAADIIFDPVSLPEGLSCSTNGLVAGTPVLAGTSLVTFVVQDSLGASTTKQIQIVIAPNPNTRPVVSSNAPPAGAFSMGEATNQSFVVWAYDPEGSNLTHYWTWDGMQVGGDLSSYTHTTDWGDAGQYELRCYVSDDLWSNIVHVQWDVTVLSDNDEDGMPNWKERDLGRDPNDPTDAGAPSKLAGMVRGGGVGLPRAYVNLRGAGGRTYHGTLTDSSGIYTLYSVQPGNYYAKAGAEHFADEWYDNATHRTSAVPYTIPANSVIGGFDFDLASGQNPALVEVTSDPSGATVYLDFQPTAQVTPVVLNLGDVASHCVCTGARIASHTVTVKKAGRPHPSPRPVPAHEAETVAMHFDLTSDEAGLLSILTTPEGADVFVDYADVAAGISPVLVGNFAPGSHVILVRKSGHLQPRPVRGWTSDQMTNVVTIAVAPQGSSNLVADVHSVPPGATVYVDYLPTTNVTDVVVDWMDAASHSGAGWYSASHTIMLRKSGYLPAAPRYVPEQTDATHLIVVHLVPDVENEVDNDHDGMADQWEDAYRLRELYPTKNGPDDDPDGDGSPNDEERRAGTNPADGSSSFCVADTQPQQPGQPFTIVFDSVPGCCYLVLCTDDLRSDWVHASGVIVASDYQTIWTTTVPDGEHCLFFRVIVLHP